MRPIKNSSNHREDFKAAPCALICRVALNAVKFPRFGALRAFNRFAVTKRHQIVGASSEVRDQDFRGSIEADIYGSLMLARTQSCQQQWIRTPRHIARDSMNHYLIQIYESGVMSYAGKNDTKACENGVDLRATESSPCGRIVRSIS